MNITGILLAAGMSSRMSGTNKLMLPFRSGTVVEESLKHLIASSVSRTVVVLGYQHEVIKEALASYESESVEMAVNNDYQSGRASSVRSGIGHLNADCDAALFMVADKPGVTTELIDRAVAEFARTKPPMLCVQTPEGRGHPIIFGKAIFDELKQAQGDQYGQALIEQYADRICWLNDNETQINVNTQEDYERLLEQEDLSNKHTPSEEAQ